MSLTHTPPISSCTNGGGQEDCDDDVEEEANKPTSCGIITDPNGTKHKHNNVDNTFHTVMMIF